MEPCTHWRSSFYCTKYGLNVRFLAKLEPFTALKRDIFCLSEPDQLWIVGVLLVRVNIRTLDC